MVKGAQLPLGVAEPGFEGLRGCKSYRAKEASQQGWDSVPSEPGAARNSSRHTRCPLRRCGLLAPAWGLGEAPPFSSPHPIFFSHLHTPGAPAAPQEPLQHPHEPNNGLPHSHRNVYSESGVPVCDLTGWPCTESLAHLPSSVKPRSLTPSSPQESHRQFQVQLLRQEA